jgi:hypothetical protein
VTPIGVAHAHASSKTATSGLDRRTVSYTRRRADIRFAGLFMPALRLAPNANARHRAEGGEDVLDTPTFGERRNVYSGTMVHLG